MLFFLLIIAYASSQITFYKFQNQIQMRVPSNLTSIKWDIIKVVSLPNGVKLPDFYFDYMDQLVDHNFCQQARILIDLEQQINDNIHNIPEELQSLADLINVPEVKKEIVQRLDNLSNTANSQDLNSLVSQVKSAMVPLNSYVNISISSLKTGYAYFFTASALNSTNQNVSFDFVYMHSEKTFENQLEIKNFSNYAKIANYCISHQTSFNFSYNLTELNITDISEVQVVLKPFFQFANDDPCVDSLGWTIRRTRYNLTNPLEQTFNLTIPITLQETLAAFIQLTLKCQNGTEFVGFTFLTIHGMVLEAGKFLEQLKTSEKFAVLAVLLSINQKSEDKIDINSLDMTALLVIAKQLSQITNLQNLKTGDPNLMLVQNVMSSCQNSFTWMIQKLKNQFKPQSANISCGSEKLNCGQHGTCTKVNNSTICVCMPGYAGNSCQYLEAEFNMLLSAQKKVNTKLQEQIQNTQNQPTIDEMLDDVTNIKIYFQQITHLTAQSLLDIDEAQNVQNMISKCVELAKTQQQLQNLLFNFYKLKSSYKRLQILNEKKSQLDSIMQSIVKKFLMIIKSENLERISFENAQHCGEIIQLLNKNYNKESDSFTIQLSQSILNNVNQQYFPIPSFSVKGLSKFNISEAKYFVFQIHESDISDGPQIEIQILDDKGNQIQANASFEFTIPTTNQQQSNLLLQNIQVALCGYFEKGSFQVSGCTTLSVNENTLNCKCNRPNSFVALKQGDVAAIESDTQLTKTTPTTATTTTSSSTNQNQSPGNVGTMMFSLIMIILGQ